MHTSRQLTQPLAWQQAMDPKLMLRLAGRAEQPGLIRLRQTHALTVRHQTMTAGLPMVALAQRGGGAILDAVTADTPIVYAQSVSPNDSTVASSEPVRSAQVRTHTNASLQVANPFPLPSAVTTNAAYEPMVTQRKMATDSAGPTLPVSRGTVAAAGVANSLAAPSVLPVIYPTPRLNDAAGVSASVSATFTGLPIIPSGPESSRATPLSDWASSASIQAGIPQTTLPLVREQPARERAANPVWEMLRARTTLPFHSSPVEPAREEASSHKGVVVSSPHSPPPQPSSAVAARQPSLTRAAPIDQGNQLNVDEIVDKVQRKFLRRLASEAERRGFR